MSSPLLSAFAYGISLSHTLMCLSSSGGEFWMSIETRERRRPGRPARLSRDQVLRAALEIADADGIEAVTMGRIAAAVGAEPMSLYRHVKNKEDLLDGLI